MTLSHLTTITLKISQSRSRQGPINNTTHNRPFTRILRPHRNIKASIQTIDRTRRNRNPIPNRIHIHRQHTINTRRLRNQSLTQHQMRRNNLHQQRTKSHHQTQNQNRRLPLPSPGPNHRHSHSHRSRRSTLLINRKDNIPYRDGYKDVSHIYRQLPKLGHSRIKSFTSSRPGH